MAGRVANFAGCSSTPGWKTLPCEGVIIIVTDANTMLENLAGRISTERARDAGAISADDAEQLIAMGWELDRAGRFTGGIPLYTVVGQVAQ